MLIGRLSPPHQLGALFLALVLGPILLAEPALGADLPAIKARGSLIAATSGNLSPVTYLNDRNELTGYDIEVGRFIAKHLGVKLDLVRLDWKGILPGRGPRPSSGGRRTRRAEASWRSPPRD
jgi:ABC-type amino acid transport substrate-binding protein